MAVDLKELCGVDFPLFAFSHCRDVVAAVSRAGGFGVLGGVVYTPESLEVELQWLDQNCGGNPYGVDVLLPEKQNAAADATLSQIIDTIPQEHRDFVQKLLADAGVEFQVPAGGGRGGLNSLSPLVAEQLIDVAFSHPIRLVASALGPAPKCMIERAREKDVAVVGLVGAKEHAIRQIEAGVDIIVAQGSEAGGHTGEVATLVLVPEVVRAVEQSGRDVAVLGAGGIMTGAQMAACMAMGASGVWTGSVWLATTESEVTETFRQKMVAATSRDTVRSKARTGKPSRQLRSAWHDAWEGPDSPGALPMPQMSILSTPAFAAIDRAADAGNEQAKELLSYWVGQGVGLVDKVKSAEQVVAEFMDDFAVACQRMCGYVS
jgi:NAD(P)H-dependent flavin oxidoreductase YrpB (nitropropane dioxygenase family)